MTCLIKNKTPHDMGKVTDLLKNFYPFAQKKIGFNRPPTIVFDSDKENAKNPLGKTAQYDPQKYAVTVYVDNRHPKDVLRSIAHELVHHAQNCRGDLANLKHTNPGYAQEDDHMREMEREAYEKGNMCFRDWEDMLKTTNYGNRRLTEMLEDKKKINKSKKDLFEDLDPAANFLGDMASADLVDLSRVDNEEVDEEEEIKEPHPMSPDARSVHDPSKEKAIDVKESTIKDAIQNAIVNVLKEEGLYNRDTPGLEPWEKEEELESTPEDSYGLPDFEPGDFDAMKDVEDIHGADPTVYPPDGVESTHSASDLEFNMGSPYKRDEDDESELEEEIEDDSGNPSEYDMDDPSDDTDPRGNPWEQMTEQEQMDFAEDVVNEHCYQEDPETDYPDMKDWKTRRKTIANDGEWYQNVLYERLLNKWTK